MVDSILSSLAIKLKDVPVSLLRGTSVSCTVPALSFITTLYRVLILGMNFKAPTAAFKDLITATAVLLLFSSKVAVKLCGRLR
jgi:hypothetical protein